MYYECIVQPDLKRYLAEAEKFGGNFRVKNNYCYHSVSSQGPGMFIDPRSFHLLTPFCPPPSSDLHVYILYILQEQS